MDPVLLAAHARGIDLDEGPVLAGRQVAPATFAMVVP